MTDPVNTVALETVTVPKAALEWLMGEAPDPSGFEFGDFPDDHPRPAGAFWWRTTFRDICLYYAPRLIREAAALPPVGEPVAVRAYPLTAGRCEGCGSDDRILDRYSRCADCASDVASPLDPKKVEGLVKAADDLLDTLRPSTHPAFRDPVHGDAVEALGSRIGFGALMSSASASWREMAERRGDPSGGEFVAGPCFSVLTHDFAALETALRAIRPTQGEAGE